MIEEKCNREDLLVYEIFRNPVLYGEFMMNFDNTDFSQEFILSIYQKEYLCDFNPYVSMMAARAVGKTQAISINISWAQTFNIFPDDYIVYSVPSKVHLEPVFANLTRLFRSNSLLQQFIEKNGGINGSEFSVTLKNQSKLMCRIAGMSGTGANVIGLHTPYVWVDECLTAQTKISAPGKKLRVSELKVGDAVYSWDENEVQEDRVSKISTTVSKEVYELGYENGKIRCSPEHRFYTKDGYKQVKDMQIGESIYILDTIAKKQWTKYEEDFIVKAIKNNEPIYYIAEKLNRSEPSVFKKVYRMGLCVRDMRELELTHEEIQILTGSFLGDGSAEVYLNRASYRANHGYVQKEYVDWLHQKLHRLIKRTPWVSRNGGWGTYSYSLQTRGHKKIKELSDLLYKNNKKTITKEYLDLLDPLGLTIWFMDDGSESGSLSTHSFSKDENEIISEWFINKWGVDNKVVEDRSKHLFFILVTAKGLRVLREIISPFIPECMQYKIGKGKYTPYHPEAVSDALLKRSITLHENPKKSLEEKTVLYKKKINTRSKVLYSIEVEKNHNYFANDILVKNSGYYPWGTWVELQPIINTWQPGFKLSTSGVPTGLREKNVLWHTDQENNNYTKHRISAFQNPRFTDLDNKKAIADWGEGSDDYIHLILGEHGKPVFSLFDRNAFDIQSYPIYKFEFDGVKEGDNLLNILGNISIIPALPDKIKQCIFGVDLGYTEPTAIWIMYEDPSTGYIKFHAKIKLTKVSYPLQEKIIDLLDTKYKPYIIGIDKGSAGISVVQNLLEHRDYVHKDYKKKVFPVDFSSWTSLGVDSEGKEIKQKTKPFAVSILQEYTNNRKIIYSYTDTDMITELERMTYTKTPTGDIVYKTLTQRGGKRGEDHFTSALLCAITSYYMIHDYNLFVTEKKRLIMARWW